MQSGTNLKFNECFKDKSVLNTNRQIATLLKTLPDYVEGEEKVLICKSLNIPLQSLLITKDFMSFQLKILKDVVKKRLKGVPLNKILKRADFYLDEFYINNYVLAPRKETELVVEEVLKLVEKNHTNNAKSKDVNSQIVEDKIQKNNTDAIQNNTTSSVKILDLCCGSGAIGLSVAKHCNQKVFVTLLDKSSKAIKITQKNAKKLQVNNIKIIKSDMFSHLKKGEKFDIIASNPPYIATSKLVFLQEGVKKYDPNIALDGGEDGLKFYRIIANNAQKFLKQKGVLVVEIGFDQGAQVKELFKQKGFKVSVLKDYSGNDRIVVAHL